MTHFNGLTPAEAERLAMLIEECGEVIQAATKVLRHGWDSHHPDNPHADNRNMLHVEIMDLQGVIGAMGSLGELPRVIGTPQGAWTRKLRWTHHQEGSNE